MCKNNKAKGNELEEIVNLIEKSIKPNATLKRNVQLPVLSSNSGNKRECDIVMLEGNPPRQLMTIFEIQNRESSVSIKDFGDWQQKMKDVGANRLICVSKKKFPKSVVEKAKNEGHSILLVEINENHPTDIPTHILSNFSMEFYDFSMKLVHVNITSEKISNNIDLLINKNNQIWTTDGVNMVSLFQLTQYFHFGNDGKGENYLEFGNDSNFYLYHSNDLIPVKLQYKYNWEGINKIIKPNILSYNQEGGNIAWFIDFEYNDKSGSMKMKIPLVKEHNQYFARSIYSAHTGNLRGFATISVQET